MLALSLGLFDLQGYLQMKNLLKQSLNLTLPTLLVLLLGLGAGHLYSICRCCRS
jgi:ascorbate-specific PTS system EIIC-type component UlaA